MTNNDGCANLKRNFQTAYKVFPIKKRIFSQPPFAGECKHQREITDGLPDA
jgi:hypothetical protein